VSPTTLPACPDHGHVTFLGAGPGDPGLLTLRAVEALASADVLVAEHEVLDVVRVHARPGVAVVNTDPDPAGPSADRHPGTGTPQLTVVDGTSTPVGVPAERDAAHLVMEAARGGRRVVRAVSGDPGLDAYAAEEMLACAAAGVPFEVVPGVAAAVGVPAYAGVPLRDAEGADLRRGRLSPAGESGSGPRSCRASPSRSKRCSSADQALNVSRRGLWRKPSSISSAPTGEPTTGSPSNRSSPRRGTRPRLTASASASRAGRSQPSSGARSESTPLPPRST